MRISIEGVTGTGKTSTTAALRRTRPHAAFYDEAATFDDFMNEWLLDNTRAISTRIARLSGILTEIEATISPDIVLERFHFSYMTLDPDWEAYRDVDVRSAACGIRLVLLDVPEDLYRSRCLYRQEFGGRDWQDLAALYGSETAAMNAISASQERRREALKWSGLQHLVIDTSGRSWDAYAEQIISWSA